MAPRTPSGPADAGAVQSALLTGGYPGAVARLATVDDPAPVGAVLFGVALAGACVLGFWSGAGSNVFVAGAQTDGRCL